MKTDDLIIKYALGLHKRYSGKQRQMFVGAAGKDLKDMGYEVRMNVGKHKGVKSINLMAGDLRNASILIVTNYDTPQHNFGNPMKYYPFNGPATFASSFLPIYAPLIIGAVLSFWLITQKLPNLDFQNDLWMSLCWLVLFLLIVTVSAIMTVGVGNRVNFNRNTSGVVAALRLAEELNTEQRKKVAFVFTDNGCRNHGGDYLLRESLPENLDQKLVILLDCVGDGDTLVVGYKESTSKEAKDLADCFKKRPKRHQCAKEDLRYSSFSFYQRGLQISRGNLVNGSLIVENTATTKDITCNAKMIDELVAGLKKYCV